jgi:hypothetical protein
MVRRRIKIGVSSCIAIAVAALISLTLKNSYVVSAMIAQKDDDNRIKHGSSRRSEPTTSNTTVSSTFSQEQCRAWGFEPSQLSCETCELLLKEEDNGNTGEYDEELTAQYFKECKTCCQPWRQNVVSDPEMLGVLPYERIILKVGDVQQNQLLMDGIPSHIAAQLGLLMSAVESPLQELIKSEEFASLVEEKGSNVIKVEQQASKHGSVMLLFNKGNSGSEEDEADEIIDLEAWGKDDIKDLIKFGLRNQN